MKTRTMIDADAVAILVEGEFKRAGFTPRDTRTGAVIITGETARKDNAALVLERLSGFAGDFVVSTAGPDLESIIAGKGSGARQYSEDRSCVVANIDIGGGTSNLVLFDRGETVCAGCLDIGGRLIRVSPDLYVDYVSESVRRIARWKGISIAEGERTSQEALERICGAMNEVLEQVFGLRPREGAHLPRPRRARPSRRSCRTQRGRDLSPWRRRYLRGSGGAISVWGYRDASGRGGKGRQACGRRTAGQAG